MDDSLRQTSVIYQMMLCVVMSTPSAAAVAAADFIRIVGTGIDSWCSRAACSGTNNRRSRTEPGHRSPGHTNRPTSRTRTQPSSTIYTTHQPARHKHRTWTTSVRDRTGSPGLACAIYIYSQMFYMQISLIVLSVIQNNAQNCSRTWKADVYICKYAHAWNKVRKRA